MMNDDQEEKQLSFQPPTHDDESSAPLASLGELPLFSRRRHRRRQPSPVPESNTDKASDGGINHRSVSWPNFGLLGQQHGTDGAPHQRTTRDDSIIGSRRQIVIAIEDQSSKWNLDIETGQIEHDVLGTPTSPPSTSASTSASTSKEATSKNHCCSGTDGVVYDAMNRIELAGGDLPVRVGAALRASMGSCLFFSLLVFTSPKYLGAIWIGNIFFHISLQGNVGEALHAARGFAKSIILTTLVSWPVAYFLGQVTEHVAQICLPIMTLIFSLLIMTCPWLTSPNLMILVMYVVIAAPVRFRSTSWWEPFGYMGSYLIGLAMAVFMNLVPLFPPTFRPNTATRQVHVLMDRLSKDFFLLFVQTRHYTYSTGESPKLARAAGAAIEVLVARMTASIHELKRLLPAVTLELWWDKRFRGNNAATNASTIKHLTQWVEFLEGILVDMKMLRCALNSRFLGEEANEHAPMTMAMSTHQIRRIIANELGEDYQKFIDALIHFSVACNQQADPTTALFCSPPSSAATASPEQQPSHHLDNTQLGNALNKTRLAFGRAIHQVTVEVQDARKRDDQQILATTIPIFAHLARRSTSTNALLSIAASLLEYHSARKSLDHEDERTHSKANKNVAADSMEEGSKGFLSSPLVGSWCCTKLGWLGNAILDTWWRPKWFWQDSQQRRLALKTGVGMLFASLWIAVPQMWEIAQPFGLWPGLTVASVNLATRGSSFHKAIDRLVGTFFAAAYALLIVEFFSGDQDSAKIPAITAFTFAAIYLKNENHAYQYSYAATSIGSIMYGSVKNSYNVQGYIPQRIQLIVVGVITFSLVELLLFPRSSQLVVEKKILKYFGLVGTFFKKAQAFAEAMQRDTGWEPEDNDDKGTPGGHKHTYSMISAAGSTRKLMEPAANQRFEELMKAERDLKSTSLTIKTELRSALLEPYFGFSQRLHAPSVNGLVSEICESETQALLLVNALKMVAEYTNEDSIARSGSGGMIVEKRLPCAYASFLDMAGKHMDVICRDLSAAYPDGYFRPQGGNTLRAITAAAAFRDFRDVRYSIITSWSQQLLEEPSSSSSFLPGYTIDGEDITRSLDPNELIVMGITTSFMLELCRHLQLAGRRIEWSAGHFPTFQ